MVKVKQSPDGDFSNRKTSHNRPPPARTARGREKQLTSLAYDQVELMLLEGTAPVPILLELLKSGSEREGLNRQRIEAEIEYSRKKTAQVGEEERVAEQNAEVIRAITHYRGEDDASAYEMYDVKGPKT